MRITYLMVWALSLATLLALAYALSKKDRGWLQLGAGSAALSILLVRWSGALFGLDQEATTAWLSPITEEIVRAWCVFRVLANPELSVRAVLFFALGAASAEPLINVVVAVTLGDIGLDILGAAAAFGLIATPFAVLLALSLLMSALASYKVSAWFGFLICAAVHAAYNVWGLKASEFPESPADYALLSFSRLILTLPLAAVCWVALRRMRETSKEKPTP